MRTECSKDSFGFAPVEGREVVAAFDGGAITSDADVLQGVMRHNDRARGKLIIDSSHLMVMNAGRSFWPRKARSKATISCACCKSSCGLVRSISNHSFSTGRSPLHLRTNGGICTDLREAKLRSSCAMTCTSTTSTSEPAPWPLSRKSLAAAAISMSIRAPSRSAERGSTKAEARSQRSPNSERLRAIEAHSWSRSSLIPYRHPAGHGRRSRHGSAARSSAGCSSDHRYVGRDPTKQRLGGGNMGYGVVLLILRGGST
jgi:hypothetical protein